MRLARSGDLDGIVDLETAAFPVEDRFPRRAWRRLLTRPSALVLVTAGPLDGSIAWLLRDGTTVARMYSLAVHPRARGQGLGRQLIAASLRRLPAHIDRLSLEVRRDNAPAVGLYCSVGFVETSRLRDYYGAGRHGIRMTAHRTSVAAMLTRRP
jgi:ribosomal protein S18 acetylase RimI-like enzyme